MDLVSPVDPKTIPPAIIKAETNVLRLPFFALQNKNLATIGGYECNGTRTHNDKTYKFNLTVSRNTKTVYPGILSRKAHNAFLSIATDRGFPLDNPITWHWRDLFRRMHITPSGTTERQSKQAVLATAGLMIQTREALISYDGKTLSTEADNITHLYDRVVFINGKLPGGATADTNYLWLSQWLLDNLNHHYYTYVDYDLWRYLDQRSPIASRLYELSLTKFYKNAVLRINYPTLAQLLPVKEHKHYSDARRQLDPHFNVAVKAGILDKPQWHRRKQTTVAQLLLCPGKRLLDFKQSKRYSPALIAEETIDHVTVKEIRIKPLPPEAKLVSDFYTRWQKAQQAGSSTTVIEIRIPTDKEIRQAREIAKRYGLPNAKKFLTEAIERMRHKFPDAMRFGASLDYIAEVADEHDALAKHRRDLARQTRLAEQERHANAARQTAEHHRHTELEHAWHRLTDEQRDDIRSAVLGANPVLDRQYRKHPDSFIVLELCLDEMTRRHPH